MKTKLLIITLLFINQILCESDAKTKGQIERRLKNIAFIHKVDYKNHNFDLENSSVVQMELTAERKDSTILHLSSIGRSKKESLFEKYKEKKIRELRDIHKKSVLTDEELFRLFSGFQSCSNSEQSKSISESIVYPEYKDFSYTKLSTSDQECFVEFTLNDWKEYFEFQLCSPSFSLLKDHEQALFKNYALYQFDEYLRFLQQTFASSYERRIVQLQNDIDSNQQFKEQLSRINNFPFAAISGEYSKIQAKEIAKKAEQYEVECKEEIRSKTSYQRYCAITQPKSKQELIEQWQKQIKSNHEPNELKSYYQKRIDTVCKDLANNKKYIQTHILDPYTAISLQKYGINTDILINYEGTALDHQFISEAVELANRAAQINIKLNDAYSETTLYLAGQVIHLKGDEFLEHKNKLLDASHAVMNFIDHLFSGVQQAVGDNKQKIQYMIEHPVESIKNFSTGLGKSFLNAVTKIVDFVIHPQSDEVYQKQFEDFCSVIHENYKNIPAEEIAEKVGYEICDFIFRKFVTKPIKTKTITTGLNTIKSSSNILSKTKIGQQAAKVIGKIKDKGIENLRNGTNIILEENGFIQSEEIIKDVSKLYNRENFIPALFDSAIECAQTSALYKNQLVRNFKRYNADPRFAKQYDDLHKQGVNVPVHVIPKGDKLEVNKLKSGEIQIPDSLGNVHIFPAKDSVDVPRTKLSETGRKAFLIKENHMNSQSSLKEVKVEKIREKFNAPKLVEEFDKLHNFCPITKSAAEKVAQHFNLPLQRCRGKGWKIEIPYKKEKAIKIRIMESESGCRTKPYFRVSHPDKGTLNLNGYFSDNRALTHINLGNDYLEQIEFMVKKCKEVK